MVIEVAPQYPRPSSTTNPSTKQTITTKNEERNTIWNRFPKSKVALLYKRVGAPSSSSPSHLSPQYIGAVVIFVHESRYQRHPKCPAEFQLRRFSLLRPHAFFNFKLRFTAIYSSGTSLHCAANPLAGFDSREGKSIASFFSIKLRASSSDRKKKKRKEKAMRKETKKKRM